MRPYPIATLALLTLATTTAAQAGAATAPAREGSFVAATRVFAFHSDSLLNLHDFLLWRAHSREPVQPRGGCLAALPAPERAGFEQAEAHYAREFATRQPLGDRLLVGIRYALAGYPAVDVVPDTAMAPTLALLRAATPAYLACWWREHDARNRAWIGELLPRLVAHEDEIRARLASLYATPWSGRLPVDVAGYIGFGGANSVDDPDHIMISAVDSANSGDSALEMVFHEASHTLLGREGGEVASALGRAASALGLPEAPRDLAHAILFYTTGRAVQGLLAERGGAGYEPYVYREGLFLRAWSRYRRPLEQHWQPYLDGRVDMDTAARNLLEALR